MLKRTRYHIAEQMFSLCALLNVSPHNVLRRANLPRDYFDRADQGLQPHQIFLLWEAAALEYNNPDLPVFLGKTLADGMFGPTVLAFTCSHTVAAGLDRIALFKPLIGPLMLNTQRTSQKLSIEITSTEPTLKLPAVLGAMDLVFFVELIRKTTGEQVVPLSATLPEYYDEMKGIEDHIGIPVHRGPAVTLTFASEVADLQLVTENPSLWAYFEKDLLRQLDAQNSITPTADRVRSVLYELLPSGKATADDACNKLNLSKRSLQRWLKSEGTNFQAVLENTREELSLLYLRKNDLTIEEISFLLAYRDPNSFYRAFHSWTGMTPAQARKLEPA